MKPGGKDLRPTGKAAIQRMTFNQSSQEYKSRILTKKLSAYFRQERLRACEVHVNGKGLKEAGTGFPSSLPLAGHGTPI